MNIGGKSATRVMEIKFTPTALASTIDFIWVKKEKQLERSWR